MNVRDEYPEGAVVTVEDMVPLQRAWAEAEHEGCTEWPEGHPLSEHGPWSGGDLDGVETWEGFVARLARYDLTLVHSEQAIARLGTLHHSPRCPAHWRCHDKVGRWPGYSTEAERVADIAAHFEVYGGTAEELLAWATGR